MREISLSSFYFRNGRYDLITYDLCIIDQFPIRGTDKSIIIIRNRITHEMMKRTMKNDQIGKSFYGSTTLQINENESPKGLFAREYLKSRFDLSMLTNNCIQMLKNYVMSKINYMNTHIHGKTLEAIIVNKLLLDHEIEYEQQFSEFIYKLFKNSDAANILDKHNKISVRYKLLRKDTNFTGKYRIFSDRYTDNKKSKTFDVINIELNMYSDYNENLKYLYGEIKNVKEILREIIECESISKDYANFLKLYNLILSRENILIARFCFKDGLEDLLRK